MTDETDQTGQPTGYFFYKNQQITQSKIPKMNKGP